MIAEIDAPPPDSALANAGVISLAVRWYCREDLQRLWAGRRDWFLTRYRWRALDTAMDYDIARYCRDA